MRAHVERGRETLEQPFGEHVDVVGVGQVSDDGELVPGHARDGVLFTNGLADALPHETQKLVADRVIEGVVDTLEVIKVEEGDRDGGAATTRVGDRGSETVEEQGAVG